MAKKGPPSPDAGTEAHTFPPDRAFVVQLSAAERSRKPARGRVEHVVTGRSARFESLEALAAFFGEVLASEAAGQDQNQE